MKELGIYVHIPFCVKKCGYCDFLSGPAGEETIARYMEALQGEIRFHKEEGQAYSAATVFIGGGTPSLPDAEYIKELLDTVRETFYVSPAAEITLEANPGTLTKEKLFVYAKAGINRLSMGLQSADNRELKLLGRIHTWEQFLEQYHLAREAGFQNINVDLMAALPGQTEDVFLKSLTGVLDLSPEHISVYDLILEEGTPFYDDYHGEKGECLLPSEEEDRRIYHRTKEVLGKAGYERYEISNYARPGFACRHNNFYWNGTDYLGLGLGASSFMKGVRYQNEAELIEYLKNAENGRFPRCAEAVLSVRERMEEFMFLGLRRMAGVNIEDFRKHFGVELNEVYGGVIQRFLKEGLLSRCEERIFLTDWGIDVSNSVFAAFLLD